ncbi:DUF218 domain-containing protein [Ruminococcus sp. YE71]|nr:DUF218 domain-containing protein [Ruminococcus sp. YE78]SFW14877.1 DUF218 domain-containing protein [Ruminococcus sp. YE71]
MALHRDGAVNRNGSRQMNRPPRKRRRIGRFRAAVGNLLILMTVYLAVFVTADMLYRIGCVAAADGYRTALGYMAVIFGIMIVLAADVRTGFFTAAKFTPVKVFGIVVRTALALLTAAVLTIAGMTAVSGLVDTEGEADNIIVLGMALENGKPNADLIARVDKAAEYAKKHPSCRVIVTGGNAADGERTEADIMKQLLTEKGIDGDRVLTEDKAADTRENFVNAAALTDPSQPVVIVSSSYHMRRAARLAGEAGFSYVMRLPAKAEPTTYCTNVMWETVMEFNHIIFGK